MSYAEKARQGSGDRSWRQLLKRFAMNGEQRNGAEARRISGVKRGLRFVSFCRQEIVEHIFSSSCVCPRQSKDICDAVMPERKYSQEFMN